MSSKILVALFSILISHFAYANSPAKGACRDAYGFSLIEDILAGHSVRNQRADLSPELMNAAMEAKSIVFAYWERQWYEGTVSSVDEKTVTLSTPDGSAVLPLNKGVADLRRVESAASYKARLEDVFKGLSASHRAVLMLSEQALNSGAAISIRQERKVPPTTLQVLTYVARVTSIHSYTGIEGVRRGPPQINIRISIDKITEEVFKKGERIAMNESKATSHGFTILTNEYPAKLDLNPADPATTSVKILTDK